MKDAEREQHIADLGKFIEKAYKEGDRAGAIAWAAARAEAINSRSPEQVFAMETRMGLAPCQFTVMGDEARAAVGASR